MPDLRDCIQSAMEDPDVRLDPTRGGMAQQLFDELKAKYLGSMPDGAASAQAAADVQTILRERLQSRRHVVLNQLRVMRDHERLVAGTASEELGSEILATLEYNPNRPNAPASVNALSSAYRQELFGMVGDLLRRHGRDALGRIRNPAQLRNVLREAHGQATGDAAARQLADAWAQAAKRARSLFNAFGGDIGELADWGVPHTHDAVLLREAGAASWSAYIEPLLDWSRILDRSTGQPVASQDRGAFLADIWSNLATDGWDDRLPSFGMRGAALYNRRGDARVLHFADADAWLTYNDAFGRSDPLDAMLGHLSAMARDIALMRRLGPNPAGGLEHLLQAAERKAMLEGKAPLAGRIKQGTGATARAMLAVLNGTGGVPANETLARAMSTVRSYLPAAQLGSALLSSVSDLVTVRLAAKTTGLNPAGVMGQAMRLASSAEYREMAAAGGWIAERLGEMAGGASRYYHESYSSEIAARLSGLVMRASGLAQWTDLHRAAFRMEFAADLGRHVRAGRGLDDMGELGAHLRARGMDDATWSQIADPALLFSPRPGVDLLSPIVWRENALAAGMDPADVENAATALSAIAEEQMTLAVPTRSIQATAMLNDQAKAGTIGGELVRSVAVYKGYPLALMIGHFRNGMARGNTAARAQYFASLIAMTTLAGALSVQLKSIAKGDDPRPMDDVGFWAAAMFQGGGLGIFGDFVKSESSRVGGGLAETILGPVAGVAGDVIRIGASNVARVSEGRDPLIGRDVVNLARRYTPGSSLWYGRLAVDRLVWDQLQDALDPQAQRLWRDQEKRSRRDYGTSPWWRKGETAPSRGPDLANVLGDQK
ncbi:hypothetical protein P2H44_22655 [Albimonas sp. CAU 1670]|uniref:hypothetical protein n=1 Tax=Albimonas sp. CAU 1670 TaxID=3032599 RepID=UPI0023DB24F4|nr:hypothetical protein [Albimonas sp. CAU 1670]MDF2235366.1 hypothetical protein [Albimonas sp. CAU 1670]